MSEPAVVTLPNGQFLENCYLVGDEATGAAVLIDPGEEWERFLAELEGRHWRVEAIWLTHAHLDHVLGVADIHAATGAPIWLHPGDRPLYDTLPQQGLWFGLRLQPPPAPQHHLVAGESVAVGPHRFEVRHTPGVPLRAAVAVCRGLRLLRQDPWECSASYILATFSNIPRIKGMIERICALYGEEIEPGLHAFPRPRAIAENGERAETCGLGFRCKRFVEYARRIEREEVDFEDLRMSGYGEAHRFLVKLEGFGDKVADCIAFFSLDHLEAFPIDVRIARTLKERYGVEGNYAKVGAFARKHFGSYAGYSQEFIYYAADRKNLDEN